MPAALALIIAFFASSLRCGYFRFSRLGIPASSGRRPASMRRAARTVTIAPTNSFGGVDRDECELAVMCRRPPANGRPCSQFDIAFASDPPNLEHWGRRRLGPIEGGPAFKPVSTAFASVTYPFKFGCTLS